MKKTFLTALLMAAITCVAYAEDGSRPGLRSHRNSHLCEITTKDKSNTAKIATRELATYWHGKPVSLIKDKTATGEHNNKGEKQLRTALRSLRTAAPAGQRYAC